MTKPRTSQTHPLQIAYVRASPAHGRIGITFCPGKHDRAAQTGAWARDLACDLDVIAAWGARLGGDAQRARRTRGAASATARRRSSRSRARLAAPAHRRLFGSNRDLRAAVARAWPRNSRVAAPGADIVVHCKGGLGRAGMIAARLLAELGVAPEQAIRDVRRARKGAIETPSQLALVRGTTPVIDVEAIDSGALATGWLQAGKQSRRRAARTSMGGAST